MNPFPKPLASVNATLPPGEDRVLYQSDGKYADAVWTFEIEIDRQAFMNATEKLGRDAEIETVLNVFRGFLLNAYTRNS